MTGVSTLGQALDQIERIKEQQAQFAMLGLQMTTGKKTQVFSGLGNDVLTSTRARASIQSLTTYSTNITNASRRITEMTSAIDQFKTQAQDFLNALVGFSQQSAHQGGDPVTYDDPLTPEVENTVVGYTSDDPDDAMKTLQQLADKIFPFMNDLLNSKDGDRYLFGGADSLNPPLTDTGTMDSAISSLLQKWKTGAITNDDLKADLVDRTATAGNPDALTDTIVGYSAALSAGNAGKTFVRVQQNSEIDYTTLGNDKAFRDIMVVLSYFKNGDLGPIADTYKPPNAYPGVPDAQGAPGATVDDQKANFYDVFNKLTGMVNDAIDRLDQLSFNLDNAQARITDIQDAQKTDKNVLQNTVSDVENVDINEVAVKVSALQTQLQASYAVTASIQQYTLVNFLSGNI